MPCGHSIQAQKSSLFRLSEKFQYMESLANLLIIVHIAGGTIALIAGGGAIISVKTVKFHKGFGRWYFYGMSAVFISAILIAVMKGLTFLFIIAFFSYFLDVMGYRSLSHKRIPAYHPLQMARTLPFQS
jgi:uncharacterized membrane protein